MKAILKKFDDVGSKLCLFLYRIVCIDVCVFVILIVVLLITPG